MRQTKSQVFAALPAPLTDDLTPQIRDALRQRGDKVVILDDDPTGTQTVHDVTVLTTWDATALTRAMQDESPAVFVLTNTRSMTPAQAEIVNREIATNLHTASQQTGRGFVVISRSDSTLRGHFPLETEVLAESIGGQVDGVLIIPAFMAGGRYTINSMHYVAEGDTLIPAAETPFARDAAFGYSASDLRVWVSEKTGGVVSVGDVATVTLDAIRTGGVDHVCEELLALQNHAYCAVDAIDERDLEVVALAALHAEAQGRRLLYRTAASFAAARAGITLRPLLTPDELRTQRNGGGLVVVGSYVPKSSSQLAYLLEHTTIERAEINVAQLLDDSSQAAEIARVVGYALPLLQAGKTVALYTSRELVTGNDAASSLSIGNRVSDSLVQMTSQVQGAARFIVAKGGITSSDVATKALRVRQARVMGQVLPGIPVWELDDDCAEPHMIYVVFPGNVGGVEAVAEVVAKLEGGA
ncbi:MAG: four-carbon acid sugar kinase family protein [Chloroflexota bacterium]